MRHKQSLFSRKLEIKQSLFFANAQNKGIVEVFVLVLILVVAIAGGAYYLGRFSTKLQPTKTQQPAQITPSPDPTANWKTYTSEDTTFSFKYPSDWIYEIKKTTLEVNGKEYNATSILAGRPLTEEQRKLQGYININDAPKTYNDFSLLYATHTDFTSLTADNLVEELISKRASQVDNPKTLLLTNNIQAKEVGYGCQAFCIDVLFRNNNTIFDASTGPNAEANISTLRQILSTFRFD